MKQTALSLHKGRLSIPHWQFAYLINKSWQNLPNPQSPPQLGDQQGDLPSKQTNFTRPHFKLCQLFASCQQLGLYSWSEYIDSKTEQ